MLVNLQEGQQVRPSDFQNIEINARRTTGSIILLMTNGKTAKLKGLRVSKDGDRVKVEPGVAVKAVDRPGEDFTRVAYAQITKDVFLARPAGTFGVNRDDVITMSPFDLKDDPTPIQFLKTDSLGNPQYDSLGRPIPITKVVSAGSRVDGLVEWIQANSSNQVSIGISATPIGIVHLKSDGTFTVEDITYEPCIVDAHRTAPVLDHPLGSVKAGHIDPNIIGPGYMPGHHLTLQQQSEEIVAARGLTPELSARLERLVDENGNIIDESVRDAVEDLLISILGNVVDENGNLSVDAVLRTGATSRFAVLSGTTSGGSPGGGGGLMPVPDGFTEDECHFLVSPRAIQFAVALDSQIVFDCYTEGRRAHCIVSVEKNTGEKPVYYGQVNYMVIGIKN